ncbi:MAG: amidophosphoribosyltransferase [Candidatus Cloacimonadales bacterium]
MCGIIGIFNNKNAANLATLGLFAEQHRGQESCGMAVTDGTIFRLRKKMGLVKDVFTPEKLQHLPGDIAVGHVRYPTCGTSDTYNSQPHVVETLAGPSYTLASNGDIINYEEIRQDLEKKGVWFASYNDGELILKYIVYSVERENNSIIGAIRSLMHEVKGAFSTVLATKDSMYLFRDPHGFRPMTYGKLADETIVVGSETISLDILRPQWQKEVQPAQIIKISKADKKSVLEFFQNDPNEFRRSEENKHCIFEQIYFSRPDSFNYGENVYEVREKIGAILADSDADLQPDAVVPVPDSANFIALGYAKAKNIPYEMGLIRNHYVGRTFIKPEQTIRDESVNQKFNVLPNFFTDKEIILVDDSIVRGTTLKKLVKLIKNAGAAKVHLRIGSPLVKYPCFYGLDTPTREELIANNLNLDEIRDYTGADSIKFMDIPELRASVKEPQKFCYACFDGIYPIEKK